VLRSFDQELHRWVDDERLILGRADIVHLSGPKLVQLSSETSVPFRSDSPDYVYGRWKVYRTSDGTSVWDAAPFYPSSLAGSSSLMSRYFTGMAMLGKRVVLGSGDYLYVDAVVDPSTGPS